jgi:creatinine amidohydrolase
MVRPGTISIRAEVLIELLFDVMESMSRHGFKILVVINGHRVVNIAWMQIAAQRAQEMLGVKVALFDPAYMSKEIGDELDFGAIGHAEEIEISHMLYKHPELIDKELIHDNPHPSRRLYHIDPRDKKDTLCYVPASPAEMEAVYDQTGDNVGGSPSRATVELGRRYHEHLVRRLVAVLDDLSVP